MTIAEKVAYLKGLAEGLDVKESKEGKLISVIVEILEEVGLSIEDLEENSALLGEELDAISDDLADVEDVLFDDEDEDEEDDEDFFAIACPNCGDDLDIDEDVLREGAVTCTACEQTFAIDCDCDCDDEDGGECCGCGCEKHED